LAQKGHFDQPTQITFGESADFVISAGLTGKLLVRSSNSDLTLMNSDGSQRSSVMPGSRNFASANACGDRYLVFDANAGLTPELWRTDADGGNPVKLADNVRASQCSPDGSWVLYGAGFKHYRIPIGGGTPVELTNIPQAAEVALLSPDGKKIA